MIEIVRLALAGAAGLLMGASFFGGLWWTVRRAVVATRPGLLFLGSLVVRTSLVLVGFHLVSGGDWKRLVACLLGFVIARALLTSLARAAIRSQDVSATGTGHAPQPR